MIRRNCYSLTQMTSWHCMSFIYS